MPIYEYVCPNCGKKFEILWRKNRTIPVKQGCPVCKTLSPRVLSTFGFRV